MASGRLEAGVYRGGDGDGKCVEPWIDRFAAEGHPGQWDRSSRPHTTPRRTGPTWNGGSRSCVTARRGQDSIGPEPGVAPRTVSHRALAPSPGAVPA
ncbi:leucine zipper domain-containing protein [Kribbella sp. NBC_01484]|uniref:leucine zipper domain-containing protein n=1 Tax=Kribbella sp. NBC_01484 TaxID=2903579 RepID=UPI003FA5FB6F